MLPGQSAISLITPNHLQYRKQIAISKKMGGIGYSVFGAIGLIALGIHNLITTIYAYLQPSNGSDSNYLAKPFHPYPTFPSPTHSPSAADHRKDTWWTIKQRACPYLVVAWLAIAAFLQALSAADPDLLVKGHNAVHRFSALQSAAVLVLFLVIAIFLFIPTLDTRLFFALLSAAFCLQSSTSFSSAFFQTSDLQGHLSSVSAFVSGFSSIYALALAVDPRLFAFEVGLWASILLQGLWNLQTGLSLYVELFIPNGCHRLLDVPAGVDGSTKCDLEDSKLRAVALLNFILVLHVLLVFMILIALYSFISKGTSSSVGSGPRSRVGSYEALPTSDSTSTINHSIQMKTLTGTQA